MPPHETPLPGTHDPAMADDIIVELRTLDALSQQGKRLAYPVSPENPYADSKLPSGSGSIRLLSLQAAPKGQDDAPLVGVLSVARLQDRPVFTTLSYVWGNKTLKGSTIRCLPYQVDLDITANCSQALRRIRRRFGAVTIWVDSICINQDDNHEKESQIPLMQDIYSLADVGYIWLGEGSDRSDLAINSLQLRGRFLARLPLTYLNTAPGKQRRLELWRFRIRRYGDIICKKKKLFITVLLK